MFNFIIVAGMAEETSIKSMINRLIVFVLMLWMQAGASGEFGWDTSQIKDQKVIDCLKSTNDAQFIAFSAMSFNNIDSDVCSELAMAKISNIPKRDVTFTPCPTCAQSADDQLSKALGNLNNHCNDSWSSRVWIDMKSYSVWPTPWQPIGTYIALHVIFHHKPFQVSSVTDH